MRKADRIQRARAAGLIGGRAATEAKAAAARVNGKRGGRPGDPEIKRIMAARGVTRQRAHQILAAQK
jgi:hypothetical protein